MKYKNILNKYKIQIDYIIYDPIGFEQENVK